MIELVVIIVLGLFGWAMASTGSDKLRRARLDIDGLGAIAMMVFGWIIMAIAGICFSAWIILSTVP